MIWNKPDVLPDCEVGEWSADVVCLTDKGDVCLTGYYRGGGDEDDEESWEDGGVVAWVYASDLIEDFRSFVTPSEYPVEFVEWYSGVFDEDYSDECIRGMYEAWMRLCGHD